MSDPVVQDRSLSDDVGEDSLSFAPTLFNRPEGQRTREATILHSYDGYFIVRQQNWKLIQGCGSGGFSKNAPCEEDTWQLYDLNTDPGESSNLYRDRVGKAEQLAMILDRYKADGRSVYRNISPQVAPR